jgi:hypothetical protein
MSPNMPPREQWLITKLTRLRKMLHHGPASFTLAGDCCQGLFRGSRRVVSAGADLSFH